MPRLKWHFLLPLMLLCLSIAVWADSSVKNPLEWVDELETQLIGSTQEGGPIERLNYLEELMTGRIREGSLVERLTRLETLVYVNQPYDASLIYKTQALEWVLYKQGFSGSITSRLETMEKFLFQKTYSGPLTKRIEHLVNQVFPGGTIKGHWNSIPEGLLIKVRVVNQLSSSQSQPGAKFQFEVAQTVIDHDFVVIPAGIIGNGILAAVNRPANLGRDARLMLDLAEVRALDGTLVKMVYGSKALQMDRSRQLAVGASAAGMLAFGPGGILLGLAIKGSEKTIPKGTEFYLQVKEPVRIYALEK